MYRTRGNDELKSSHSISKPLGQHCAGIKKILKPRRFKTLTKKMANRKEACAGLPGIAPPDEKEVYETDDLPEADQDPEFSEAESEAIERPHLNISAAHTRFRDKILVCGKDVDFSDKYRTKRHTGYQAVSGEWEIAGQGEKETILQRCNRLQCEFNELLEEINMLKESGADEKMKEVEVVEPLVSKLQQSMVQINSYMNLSDSGNTDFTKFLSDPKDTPVQNLLSKLDQLKGKGSSEKKGRGDESEPNAMITYHLQTFPAHNKFVQTVRLTNLEQRINKLENVIGTTPENLNRLSLSEFKNLSEAAKEISGRVNLLDAAQLDKIDGKLGAIISKMDNLVAKQGGQEKIDTEKKINELYESLGKTEALNQSIKPVIERLIALKSLHMEAGEFKKTLKELETDQVNSAVTLANNEAALKSVKESLEKHLEIVTKNLKAFNDRLSGAKK